MLHIIVPLHYLLYQRLHSVWASAYSWGLGRHTMLVVYACPTNKCRVDDQQHVNAACYEKRSRTLYEFVLWYTKYIWPPDVLIQSRIRFQTILRTHRANSTNQECLSGLGDIAKLRVVLWRIEYRFDDADDEPQACNADRSSRYQSPRA